MRPKKMKCILMMHTMRAGNAVPNWPRGQLQAHIALMTKLNEDLHESGELVWVEGLSFPDLASWCRRIRMGLPLTDGVFLESKEFLAGFWIVEVETRERACAIAAWMSPAPGPGGAPLNMPIEMRRVMSLAPPEMM